MGTSLWLRRPPPPVGEVTSVWQRSPGAVADLPLLRRQLREAMRDGVLPPGGDAGERLLLAVEELASNGLRHGRPPVEVSISATSGGWLLRVSDAATDHPPAPAIDRDPARGGMGLKLVGRLCGAHGWVVDGDRKVVWVQLGAVTPTDAALGRRFPAAMERAHGLTARLMTTAAQLAATLDAMAEQATAAGRLQHAHRYSALAVRAELEAERARWASLPASAPRGVATG